MSIASEAMDVVDAFLSDLEMGVIPITAALSWIKELRREGFHDLAHEIEVRWPNAISTVARPA